MNIQEQILAGLEGVLDLAAVACLVAGGIKGAIARKDGLFHPLFFLAFLFLGFQMALRLHDSVARNAISFGMHFLGFCAVLTMLGMGYFRIWRKAFRLDAKK